MDISDRTESQAPLAAIPAHLVFAFEEWIVEQIREACDRHDLAQLERLRTDVAITILDRLDGREELTEPEDIAEADAAIAADRRTAYGLLQLLRA